MLACISDHCSKESATLKRIADNSVCHKAVDYSSIFRLLAVKHKVPGLMPAHHINAALMSDFVPEALLKIEDNLMCQSMQKSVCRTQ